MYLGVYDGSHEKQITSSDGWVMQGHKVVNLRNPDSTDDKQTAVTVNFGDTHYLFKKKPPTETGGSFSYVLDHVTINMNSNILCGLPSQPFVDSEAVSFGYLKSHVYDNLSETLLWEYYTRYRTALYKLDPSISSEVIMDSTTRKVSKLFDQTFYENHAE